MIAACLLIAACNAIYAAEDERQHAVKTKIPAYQSLDDWATKKMIPEGAEVDDWGRRWMERDRNLSFDLQVERTFGRFDDPVFSDSFPPGQPFPPSDIGNVGGVPIGGVPPRQ